MLYVTVKRAKFKGISGPVNLPYGTQVECENGFIRKDGKKICRITSHNAHEFFSPDDDGNGLERGKLVQAIKKTLENRDAEYQARWNKVWEDGVCRKYKRIEHEDFWLWNHEFFCAPMCDLWHIARLVGANI